MEILYECEKCGKKIGGREMCGYIDGHICLSCGITKDAKDYSNYFILAVPAAIFIVWVYKLLMSLYVLWVCKTCFSFK